MASQPWSPLILCFPFQALQIIQARTIQPIDFLNIISWHHLWEGEDCLTIFLSMTKR